MAFTLLFFLVSVANVVVVVQRAKWVRHAYRRRAVK
jgi:hypothetical protein